MQDPNTDYGCLETFLSAVNTVNSVHDCRRPANSMVEKLQRALIVIN